MEQVFLLLDLDQSVLPQLTDDPQLARIEPLINAFIGKLPSIKNRIWLVVDDLNEPDVTPAIRDTALAMARAVELQKPENLWLALLGYNAEIQDPDLLRAAVDHAEFPNAKFVADHLVLVAGASPVPLTAQRAKEIADLLFVKYPGRDKVSMTKMTLEIERLGEKLKAGQQP
jgi:hypothetical protein